MSAMRHCGDGWRTTRKAPPVSMQIPEEPEHFRGDLIGYLAWARQGFVDGPLWCPTHWAPAPVEGANGLLATIRLITLYLETLPRSVRRLKEPVRSQQLNAYLHARATPFCCEAEPAELEAIWNEARKVGQAQADTEPERGTR